MTEARIVRIMTTDDARVILVKPDPSLRFVMGRFAAARYDADRHAYVLPADLRTAFDAFARLHGMVIVEGAAPTPTKTHTPATFHAEAIPEARRLELAASAKRGAALCRAMMIRARAIHKREAR